MDVMLKAITPRIEETIVEIARVSSSRTDKTENPAGLINYLIKNKHWSPFEHGFITMGIETSKAIGIQLLRHRSFTFQEFSQRYAKVTSIEEVEIRKQAEKNRQSSEEVFDPEVRIDMGNDVVKDNANGAVHDFFKYSQNLYNALLEAGVAKECARMVLPMATSTTIYMTGSVRSWIHMVQLRDDGHAQKEAQEIAKLMKAIFVDACPIISEALGWK